MNALLFLCLFRRGALSTSWRRSRGQQTRLEAFWCFCERSGRTEDASCAAWDEPFASASLIWVCAPFFLLAFSSEYANYYQGLWDCPADEPDELDFKRGDLVYIISKVSKMSSTSSFELFYFAFVWRKLLFRCSKSFTLDLLTWFQEQMCETS